MLPRALMLVAIAVCALCIASVAWAVKPNMSPGCWGTCGGDAGPIHGYFTIAKDRVTGFEISEKCLGKEPAPDNSENVVLVPKNMSISAAGAFTYTGVAKRSDSHKTVAVHVALKGMFATPTRAVVALTIGYGACGTLHATINKD